MQVFVTKTRMLICDSPNSHATFCVLLKAVFPRLQLWYHYLVTLVSVVDLNWQLLWVFNFLPCKDSAAIVQTLDVVDQYNVLQNHYCAWERARLLRSPRVLKCFWLVFTGNPTTAILRSDLFCRVLSGHGIPLYLSRLTALIEYSKYEAALSF